MRKINKIMIMVLALVFCFSLAAQAAFNFHRPNLHPI